MEQKKYILNSCYSLYNDENRVVLINDGANYSFHYIHPIYAALLSFFKGDKYFHDNIIEISEFFNVSENAIEKIVSSFICNPKEVTIKYDNEYFSFPPQLLIENTNSQIRTDLCRSDYEILPPYNFKTIRMNIPKDIVFVINNKCVTDCQYCYANKQHQYTPLNTSQILSIIDDAKRIGIRHIDISGGELFLQPDWDIILKHLLDCGFTPYISTKVPISKNDINKLKNLHVKELQISIDTIDCSLLFEDLHVKEAYIDKMKKTLKALDEADISIILKGTQTKSTLTVENIKQIVNFASTLKHVKEYNISTIGFMHYKPATLFYKIHPTIRQIDEIKQYVSSIKDTISFPIRIDDQSILKTELCNGRVFQERSLCTANVTGFVILPDGLVTICEELYWNKQFLIGDLKHQTIKEVWKSDKATSLWNLQQSAFSSNNPCAKCGNFKSC